MLNQPRWGNLLLLICLVLYALNQQVKAWVDLPGLGYLLRFHANDFLDGVAFAACFNLILSLSRWPEKRLCRPGQFIAAGLCSLFWEGITPVLLPHSIGDPLDAVAYVLRMLLYWLLWGRRA